jgi:hypothetical protein
MPWAPRRSRSASSPATAKVILPAPAHAALGSRKCVACSSTSQSIDLGAQAELVRDLCDRRAAQHVVSADEHGAFLGTDAEPLEQRLALGVGVDVVPAERDQVAL